MKHRIFLFALLLILSFASLSRVSAQGIFTISTSQTSFFVGEPIEVSLQFCNKSEEKIKVASIKYSEGLHIFITRNGDIVPVQYAAFKNVSAEEQKNTAEAMQLEKEACAQGRVFVAYDEVQEDFAISRPGRYSIRASFPIGERIVQSNDLQIAVIQPIGTHAQALQFITNAKLKPFVSPSGRNIEPQTQTLILGFLEQFGETRYAATMRKTLRESGKGPMLAILPEEKLDLGIADIGEQGRLPMLIKNIGTDPLEIASITVPEEPFSFTGLPQAPLILNPGEWREIEVMFRPKEPGEFVKNFTVESNDIVFQTQSIELYGVSPGKKPVRWWPYAVIAFAVIGILGAWHEKLQQKKKSLSK